MDTEGVLEVHSRVLAWRSYYGLATPSCNDLLDAPT